MTTMPENTLKDRQEDGAWTFDGFGEEFDDHVVAHLPVYDAVQQIVAQVSSFTLPDGGIVADLGASTGRTVLQLLDRHPGRRITAHLYDADSSMLDVAGRRLGDTTVRVHLHDVDLTDPDSLAHERADLTLALWLLQFLHPRARVDLLRRARQRAADSGVILLATKVRQDDARWQEIADAALVDHKAEAGVTPEEVLAKARSLRGVLIPETVGSVAGQLLDAGWHAPCVVHAWHTWALIGAWAAYQ